MTAKQPNRCGVGIDSSALIAAERGQIDVGDISAHYAEGYVAISAVIASELLDGVHR